MDLTDVPHQRFGERAVALPAPYAALVRDGLREAGSFPRVVGAIQRPDETTVIDEGAP